MNKSQKSSDLAEKDHSLEKSDLEENTILQDSEVLCEAGESIKENGMRKNDVEKMKSLELKRLKNVGEIDPGLFNQSNTLIVKYKLRNK